jgi:hypothetical protein
VGQGEAGGHLGAQLPVLAGHQHEAPLGAGHLSGRLQEALQQLPRVQAGPELPAQVQRRLQACQALRLDAQRLLLRDPLEGPTDTAEADPIALGQRLPGGGVPVHRRAVLAAQVLEPPTGAVPGQPRVVLGDPGILEHEAALGVPADLQRLAIAHDHESRRPLGWLDGQLGRHEDSYCFTERRRRVFI